MSLPLLNLSGTPYEQGLMHGSQLRDAIHHNLEIYFHRFEFGSGLPPSEVRARAEKLAHTIAAHSPDYFAGMEGIAAGSGIPLADIAVLNGRYEIIYYQSMAKAVNKLSDGCTAFAVSPKRSSNQHLLLGQNWDWIPGVSGALLRSQEEDGMGVLSFTEAGIFGGKIGLNSHGLGLAINGLTSTADQWSSDDMPFHVRCYLILRQQRFEDAVSLVVEKGRACSANFLIAQTPDQALDIEAAPNRVHSIPWQDGVLAHSNHFVAPEASGIVEPPNEFRPSSCFRLDRMTELLKTKETVSIPWLKQCLTDHHNPPRSICRHENPSGPVDEQFRTITSIIMDLEAGQFNVTDGPPCGAAYQAIDLNS